jgi:hypothetical protein
VAKTLRPYILPTALRLPAMEVFDFSPPRTKYVARLRPDHYHAIE